MKNTNRHNDKIQDYISKVMYKNELDNDSLVQIIELCGLYLNIKKITTYAKDNKMSYNGVKKCRNIINLFDSKYVIDND